MEETIKKFKGRKRKIKHLEQAPQMKKRIATFIAMYQMSDYHFASDTLADMLIGGHRGLISESEDSLIKKFEEIYNIMYPDPEKLENPNWRARTKVAFDGFGTPKTRKSSWEYNSNDIEATSKLILEEAREIMTDLFEEIVFG